MENTTACGLDAPSGAPSQRVELWKLNMEISQRVYTPLPPQAIRTVKLHKGEGSGLIKCSLACEMLATGAQYEALSYVWGAEEVPQEIILNSQVFKVTRNLEECLRHLRSSTSDRTLWIDALCINQSDIEEKTDQVKRMKDIYVKGMSTLVWLGPSADDSNAAMDEMEKIGSHIARNNGILLFQQFNTITDAGGDVDASVIAKLGELIDHFLDDAVLGNFPISAFLTLLSRGYWTRVWIQQEFSTAHKVEVLCGYKQVPFQYFHAALLYLSVMKTYVVVSLAPKLLHHEDETLQKYFDDMSKEIPQHAHKLCGMHTRLQENKGEAYESLFQVLARIHVGDEKHCKLSRDKILAILGLTTDAKDLGIDIDYNPVSSVTALYTSVAKAIIDSGQVDLLSLAQCREPQSDGEVPSWVPDWRAPMHIPAGQFVWNTPFNSCGSFTHQQATSRQSSADDLRLLSLNGWQVDTVETVKRTWQPRRKCCSIHCKIASHEECSVHFQCPLQVPHPQCEPKDHENLE